MKRNAVTLKPVEDESEARVLRIGRNRTEGFIDHWISRQEFAGVDLTRGIEPLTLTDVLASAYLQGVRDAFEALRRKNMLIEDLQ